MKVSRRDEREGSVSVSEMEKTVSKEGVVVQVMETAQELLVALEFDDLSAGENIYWYAK